MRLVLLSDTHMRHDEFDLPPGDVLVHAGDATHRGRPQEVEDFARWLHLQPHRHKVFIAGNHDFLFQDDPERAARILRECCPRVHYLQDSGVFIEGVRFWGSPWQPEFLDWAFNLPRGEALAAKWALIPADTRVLITHTPPHGVLDLTTHDEAVGCEELARELAARLKPEVHVFGHIHEARGTLQRGGTLFVNASNNSPGFGDRVRGATVIELETRQATHETERLA